MSYDSVIYIILFIILLILIERVFLNDINFTKLKTDTINHIKNINIGNVKEGYTGKKFKHRGESTIADTKRKSDIDIKLSKQDEQVIKTVETTYSVAEDFAKMVIKMPYQFLNKILERVTDFAENMNDIIEPIKNFFKQMYNLALRVWKQFFNMFLKYLKMGFAILRNLPGFIRRQSDKIISFISGFIMNIIESLENFAKMFQTILDAIMKLPSMLFKLVNQIFSLIINLALIIINIPSFFIGMIVSLQEQMLGLMDKSFGIPFMDLFFK